MKLYYRIVCSFLLVIFFCSTLQSQILNHSWERIVFTGDDAWFATDEAQAIAENVLLYQRDIGGWPKNICMQNPLSETEIRNLRRKKSDPNGCTTDNGACFLEMTYLSKMYKQVPDERYKEAFLRALNYLLDAQYENGGWPQFFPKRKGYYSHITYNDNSMVNILRIMKSISYKPGELSIVPDEDTVRRTRHAFEKGIECILKTQYKQQGVLTSWCAQYDENMLVPAQARSYELPSLSGQESAGIVLLLMSIDTPSAEVKEAVNSAVAWFEKTKITGLRQERYLTKEGMPEKRMVVDSTAPPLWARFMELEDNTPFFCDRDGVKKASMLEIGQERRSGYAWYTDQPREVLKAYPAWKAKLE